MKIANAFPICNIAVLVNMYDLIHNKERYNMIELEKYKVIKDNHDRKFRDNVFVILIVMMNIYLRSFGNRHVLLL